MTRGPRLAPIEHAWFGSLHLELRGDRVADVLALLSRQGTALHHVRVRGGRCTLVVGLRDFPALLRVCRRCRVRIRILERSGLPFALRKLRRRPSFVAGFGMFIVLLSVAGSVIWQVDVEGVDEDVRVQVLQAARDSGLYPGAWRSRIPNP
ncbi:MAG: sporulation protein YqfD, partial [Alicyclobacillus sp.]|nr:sporulation protein YqfD [Alicyclobacillus sp.]